MNHAQGLAQGLAEQALDAQAELDGCVRERRAAPALAARRSKPLHAMIQPHRQRATCLQRRVVRLPVCRAVLAPLPVLRFCHALSLRVPVRPADLCNKAVSFEKGPRNERAQRANSPWAVDVLTGKSVFVEITTDLVSGNRFHFDAGRYR